MKTTALAVVTSLAFAIPALASPVDLFTSFYAFGDSLSDDGKLADGALNSLSDGGRFSNGTIWTELLAQEFEAEGLANENYALGGATAQGGDATTQSLSNFQGQRNALGANALGIPIPLSAPLDAGRVLELGRPGDNPLTSVWFGANDLLGQNALPNREDLARNAANAVTQGAFELFVTTGGLFDDFLIANLPDIGLTPLYQLDAFSGARLGTAAEITAATLAFNDQLKTNIVGLRSLGLNVVELDVFSLFNAALSDPIGPSGAFPFFDVTNPCTASFGLQGPNCEILVGEAGVNGFLFADSIHPTAGVHGIIAAEARAALVAPVPLPAGLPLMLLGLGTFAALRRRKAA